MINEFAERKVKATSNGPSYVLMLQIDRGERFPIPFRQTNLSNNKIVATIDEYNNNLYLWFGKDCSEISKKLALNTALSIKKIGYKHGQLHVGPFLKDFKIIDESKLSDTEIQNNHSELTAIFNRKFSMKDQFLVEVISKSQVDSVRPVEQESYKSPEPELQPPVTEPVATVSEPIAASEPVKPSESEVASKDEDDYQVHKENRTFSVENLGTDKGL